MRSRLWLNWTIVNAISFSIATYVSISLATASSLGGPINGLGIIGAGGIVGAIVGVGQECLLRRKLRGLGLWTLATTAGGTIGWAIGGGAVVLGLAPFFAWLPAGTIAAGYIATAINGACIGAVVGLAQFWVLRRSFTKARRWIIASVVGRAAGWVSAALVFSINSSMPPLNGSIKFLIVGAVGGVVYGAITGFCLTQQLQYTPRLESSMNNEQNSNH